MAREIYYENHTGEIVRFDGPNLRVKENDLRNYDWAFTLTNKPSGYGSRLNRFSRFSANKSISVVARGTSRDICIETLNRLHAIIEKDVVAWKPGKLWLDGQYLICFLGTSSEVIEWRGGFHFLQKKIGVLATYPFWYTETLHKFIPGEVTAAPNGKRYSGRYPYQYGTGYSNKVLNNDHFSACPAIITIYGPCIDPQIYIAGNLYGLDGASAGEGEHIIIDQVERTIYRVSSKGEITNLFDYRIKTSDNFAYIPSGSANVQFSGDFGFDVKLMQQRSEPKWI